LIALPLQGKYLEHGNTAFINKDGEIFSDQWNYIRSFKKISEAQIDKILNKIIISFPRPKRKNMQPEISEKSINKKARLKTTQSPEARLILSNQIFIPETFLPDKLYKFLKSKLNFPNPQYFEKERLGYSTWKTSQFIKTLEIVENGILTPAGFLENIKEFAKNNDLKLSVKDQQVFNKPIRFSSKLKLKPEQQKIARKLLKQNRIVLEAEPGFGKTIVALYCMKRRKKPTLIIVHTRPLLHQWRKRIEEWFVLKEKDIGIIGEGKWQIGKKVTVASYQTLVKRGLENIKPLFGLVIIDECHHVPARTLTEVVKQLSAKFFLGLTATAFRKDKLERLINFYVGPTLQIPHQKQVIKTKKKKIVTTKLITKKTNFQVDKEIVKDFHEIARELIADPDRNKLIVRDLVKALEIGAKCLVLTERVDHCQILLKETRKQIKGIHAAAISGRITKKKRAQLLKRLKQDKFQLLIATGKLIGEGFDWPELTYLFLAFPFSWKGKLIQYIGRAQRLAKGKKEAYVYDYLDYEVPVLRIMYFRRLRTYRSLGLRKEKVVQRKPKISDDQLSLF